MSDELEYSGGHIDTPLPEDVGHRPMRPSDPIDTPYPTDGIAARPQATLYPEPRFWRLRQRANPYFMGRESLMASIHLAFQSHPIVHLHGSLGSGMTQTALAYAFRARPNFDAVFWIDGKDFTLARFDFARAGTRLDDKWRDEVSLDTQLSAITAWMRTHLRWLLVVDGATEFNVIRQFLPSQPTGRILVTGNVPLNEASVHGLPHPPFTHQQAGLFLAHRAQQERDKTASSVARMVNYATLPLFLAGSYCEVTGTSLKDYHEQLQARLADRVTRSVDDPQDAPVLATVAISLHHLSETNPAALELMALCAFLDTEDIALAMLCDGAPFLPKRLAACVTEPKALNATLTLLHRLALVQFEQNSLAIHPSVQAATRQLLGNEQEFAWLMTALRVVREAFPVESKYGHPIPACSMLLRHVFAVTARSEKSIHLREGTGLLLNYVGLYLHACKEHQAARECFERSIRLAESLYGPAHPAIAARVNSLGVILQDMRLFDEARACYERAFSVCEAVYGPARDAALGPAHRSMLTMPSRNLCQVLELMGDITGAKAAYQRAIKTFMEVYCWNHSLVAEGMNGLGQLFFKEKNLTTARQYFEKAVQAEENAEEKERGNLSRFLRNLGQCLMEEDAFREALECYQRALAADRKDYGAKHRHVASDLMGVGKASRALSLYDDAHRAYDEALAIYKAQAQGPSKDQAQAWRQKGRAYMDTHDYAEAVDCLNEALVATRMAEGPDSPALGPEYFHLGRALARMDRLPEAEKALRAALELHWKHAWTDEETLNALYQRLGRVMKELRRTREAIALIRDSVLREERRFGTNHDNVGTGFYNLGLMYMAAYDYEAALEQLDRARAIFSVTRGPDDTRTRRTVERIDAIQNLV